MPERDNLVETSIENSSLSPRNSQTPLRMVGFTPHPMSTILGDERILKLPGRPLDPTSRFPLTRITMPTSTSSPVSRTNPHNIQHSNPPIPPSRAFSQEPSEMLEILRQRRKPRSGGGTPERLRRIVAGAESEAMREFLREWAREANNSIENVITKSPIHPELEVTAVTVVSAHRNSLSMPRKRSVVSSEDLIDPSTDLSLTELLDPLHKADSLELFNNTLNSNKYLSNNFSSSYSNENNTKNQQLNLINNSIEDINKPSPVPPMLMRIRPKHPNMKFNYRKSDMETEEYSSDDDVVVYEYESDEDIEEVEGDETLENQIQAMAVMNNSTQNFLEEIGLDDSKNKPRKTWTAFFNPVMKTL
ncbi:hypothetical protein HK096_010456, partial [Nowakowskiella sp. JEL0078]